MIDQNASRFKRIADLLSEDGIDVVTVNRTIARHAAIFELPAATGRKKLKLPDAIIIATALDGLRR